MREPTNWLRAFRRTHAPLCGGEVVEIKYETPWSLNSRLFVPFEEVRHHMRATRNRPKCTRISQWLNSKYGRLWFEKYLERQGLQGWTSSFQPTAEDT